MLETIALTRGQSLEIERGEDDTLLSIVGAEESFRVTFRITADGPILELPSGMRLRGQGRLSIEAEQLSIHGTEAVSITSGGNVNVRANDDVKLDGERILLNCDDDGAR